jgi:carnitine O-acetyltransferase
VYDYGVFGFLGEHSCMDGTPTFRMNEFVLASLARNAVDFVPARTGISGSDLPAPKELKFVVDAKVQEAVDGSCQRFDELVSKHDLHVSPSLLSSLNFYLNLDAYNCQVLH